LPVMIPDSASPTSLWRKSSSTGSLACLSSRAC
jgi:hypothetical protein